MDNSRYDAAIIGSGIGGLVCGNYLAEAGKKVLILEKNSFPGGCCSSFMMGGFFFDSGAHLITGEIMAILRELKIYNKKDYIRLNPIAVVCFDDKRYFFRDGYNECLSYLKSQFPKEDLDNFFSLMNKSYIYLYYKFRNTTFQDVLNRYFKDPKARAIFYSFIFSAGTIPEKMSVAIALKFLKAVFTYGVYYPDGGMQRLSDRLAKNLCRNGGKIIFNDAVKRILVKRASAYGLLDSNNEEFYAKAIVSNISPISAFGSLVKSIKAVKIVNDKISNMELADSVFAVHIALKKPAEIFRRNTFYFYLDIAGYKKSINLYFSKSRLYKPFGLACTLNGNFLNKKETGPKISLNLKTVIYYMPREFWDECKERIADFMIADMENIVPGFKDYILFRKITVPTDIEYFTGNNEGSIGGWAMTPEHPGRREFSYKSGIKNLYFTGHWTYPGAGVSNAAISGRNLAKLILNPEKC